MYVSPAVRSIRDDPISGEPITLLLEIEDDYDPDGDPASVVAAAVDAAGGTVEDELQFNTLRVTVPQDRVASVCDIDGLAVIETDNAVVIDPDGAGEDIEYEPR